jgi:6-pyruvoyltetrahydropterin/6-carboxytetrahydropterin synthase
MSDFTIRVAGDDLLFSAGHFITFESGECEPLHGHDYRPAVEVRGPLNAGQYVLDFLQLKAWLKEIVAEWDHRVLAPRDHPQINIHLRGDELEISLGRRRWVLPKDDCVLLPIANTTSELLARHLAERLAETFSSAKLPPPNMLRVELGESNGFTAIYQKE